MTFDVHLYAFIHFIYTYLKVYFYKMLNHDLHTCILIFAYLTVPNENLKKKVKACAFVNHMWFLLILKHIYLLNETLRTGKILL